MSFVPTRVIGLIEIEAIDEDLDSCVEPLGFVDDLCCLLSGSSRSVSAEKQQSLVRYDRLSECAVRDVQWNRVNRIRANLNRLSADLRRETQLLQQQLTETRDAA